MARGATVCVFTIGDKNTNEPEEASPLERNFEIFKEIIPNVCKFAPNSVLLIVTTPGINCAQT